MRSGRVRTLYHNIAVYLFGFAYNLITAGSYGKVKEGFCIETLERVAIKIMKQVKLRKIPGGEQNVKRVHKMCLL